MPQPMTTEYFDIAGQILKVSAAGLGIDPDGSLAAFRVCPQKWDHSVQIACVDALPGPEGEEIFADGSRRVFCHGGQTIHYSGPLEQGLRGAVMRICREDENSQVQFLGHFPEGKVTNSLLLQAMEVTHRVTAAGGFLLHGAQVSHGGRAIVFTAPSGVGKSTQADLWVKHRGAEIINGDRSVIRPEEKGVVALGIPYGGSSGIAKKSRLQLSAIVYVQQAACSRVRRLSGLEAFKRIWEGCSLDTWCASDVEACTDAVLRVMETVPVYLLECTPDESAVAALEGVLTV